MFSVIYHVNQGQMHYAACADQACIGGRTAYTTHPGLSCQALESESWQQLA